MNKLINCLTENCRALLLVYIFILFFFRSVDEANACDSLLTISDLTEAFQKTNKKDTLKPYVNHLQNCYQIKNDLNGWILTNKIKIEFQKSTIKDKVECYDSLFTHSFFREPLNKKEQITIVGAYISLAYYQRKLNRHQDAIENYEFSYILNQKYSLDLKNYDIVKYCLKPLANIYTRIGDYQKSIQTFQKAEKQLIINNGEPDNFASLYFNWGRVYNDLEKYDNEISLYEKGLNLDGISKLYQAKMSFVLIEGKLQKHKFDKTKPNLNELDEVTIFDAKDALIQLEKLIKVFQLRVETNSLDGYNLLNGAYSVMGEIAKEFDLYSKEEILKIHKKALKAVKMQNSGNPYAREIAKKHYIIGQTYLDFSEIDSAKNHFNLGLKTILPKFNPKQNPLPNKELFFNENAIFENLEGLAEVFTLQDSLDLALKAYELAFYVKLDLRSIYDFESSKLYLQQKAKEVNSKAIEVASQLYLKTNDKQYIQRAFKIAESSRALVLLENIAKNQLLKQDENADSVFAEQKAEFDQPIGITELQNHLTQNETLIEYFQTDSILYAFKIGKDKTPEFYQLKPNLNQLDQLLEALRKPNNSAKEVSLFKNLAIQLYEDILAPLQIPAGKKIIIIPDGQFNFLPFEVLLTKATEENSFKKLPYLLKNHIVNYQYSATIFARLQQQTNQARLNKVLSIAPVFESKGYTLNASKEEVNEISKIFPSDVLLRELATKENILNKIGQYNVLHFSTHASGGDQLAKEQAYIVLHQDTLYLNEIYQQPINADLVTLSACETNLGKYEGGEGVMSLSRAFAYAGCPGLVSTLWLTNDQSAKGIMTGFYKNLDKGLAKDEALQQAKWQYLNTQDDAHPFYWAGLVAIGNMRPLKKDSYISWQNYLWLLFPLSLGALFIVRRNMN